MPEWPIQKKPLLLKGTLQDLMRVNAQTGEAQFIYRKAKHFEETPVKPEMKYPKHMRPQPNIIKKLLEGK